MAFALTPPPYDGRALAPVISPETFAYHHGHHQKRYVDQLNQLTLGTPLGAMPLAEVVRVAPAHSKLFHAAAQVWNHEFYWKSLVPGGLLPTPGGALAAAIERDFGSMEHLRQRMVECAEGQFGAGWVWLVRAADPIGRLRVTRSGNADLPMRHHDHALLAIDVWEHAYYLDYRDERAAYVSALLSKLANWRFAEERLLERA